MNVPHYVYIDTGVLGLLLAGFIFGVIGGFWIVVAEVASRLGWLKS